MAKISRNFPQEIRNELSKIKKTFASGILDCEIPMQDLEKCIKKVNGYMKHYKPSAAVIGNDWELQSQIIEILTDDSSDIMKTVERDGIEKTTWNNYEILNLPNETICFKDNNLNPENYFQRNAYIIVVDTDKTENIDETANTISRFITAKKYINIIFSGSSNTNEVFKLYYKKIKRICGNKKLSNYITIMYLKDIVGEDLEAVLYRDFYRLGCYEYVLYASKTLELCTQRYQREIYGMFSGESKNSDIENIEKFWGLEMMSTFKYLFVRFSNLVPIYLNETYKMNSNNIKYQDKNNSSNAIIKMKNQTTNVLNNLFCEIILSDKYFEDVYQYMQKQLSKIVDDKGTNISDFRMDYVDSYKDVYLKIVANNHLVSKYKDQIKFNKDYFNINFKHKESLCTIREKIGDFYQSMDKIDTEIKNIRFETLVYSELIKLQSYHQTTCQNFIMEMWNKYFEQSKKYYSPYFSIKQEDVEMIDFYKSACDVFIKIDTFNRSIDTFCKIGKEERNRRERDMALLIGLYDSLK